MSDRVFIIIGNAKVGEFQHVEAVGTFPDQALADDFIRDVLDNTRFKVAHTWRSVRLHDPNVYRRDSDNVPA